MASSSWPLRAFSASLAVLGPLAVFWVALWGLESYSDSEDEIAERNAGRILNGLVLERDAAEVMDSVLETRRPDVLILGPSYANTDVSPDILAARLGIDRDRITLLSVPNSVGSHWFAMLKYRVFGNGHQPPLIVVVSGLQSMLLTTPLTESSFVNLRVHLPPEGDPVVDARVKEDAWLTWARLREQRGKVRGVWFDLLRRVPLLWMAGDRGRMTALEARGALDRVFDDARIDMRLYGRSTPVVEANRGLDRYYTPEMLPPPEEGFLPEITELARQHGSRVVWVRPPMSPHIPEHLDDRAPEGFQERAQALVEERGGLFVDMRALPMTAAMFKNEDHMNEEGSRRFSEALAATLLELDALAPLAAEPARALPVEVRVEGDAAGEPPALPGQGPWVLPGTRRVYALPGGWERRRGPLDLAILLEEPGRGFSAPARVSFAGQPVLLEPGPGPADRSRWEGRVTPEAPSGPFEVAIDVPAGGRPVRVVGLALGRRAWRTFLEGDAPHLDGRQLALLGATRLEAGRVVDDSLHPVYGGPPTRVPGEDRPVLDLPDHVAAFATENWAFLSDEAMMGATRFRSRCSPLRITEDGVELPHANVPCLEVSREGHGRSCHTTDRIFFTASDGSDPFTNGRTYRLVLDPDRRCDGSAWIYPTDTLRLTIPAERTAELTDGAAWAVLDAKYLNFRKSSLQIRWWVDGRPVVDEVRDGRELKDHAFVWRFDPPVPPGAEVALELQSKDYVFYLLTEVTLSERAPSAR